jgi:hypothetical protein
LSREIYSAETDLFGQFMRIIEIVCIPMYLSSIFSALEHLSVIMVRESELINDDILSQLTKDVINRFSKNGNLARGYNHLVKQCGQNDIELFGGRIREFLWIEVFVFMFFILTMLVLMIKSRFMPVGVDNSGQFAEDYMSFLAEKIVRQIDINK